MVVLRTIAKQVGLPRSLRGGAWMWVTGTAGIPRGRASARARPVLIRGSARGQRRDCLQKVLTRAGGVSNGEFDEASHCNGDGALRAIESIVAGPERVIDPITPAGSQGRGVIDPITFAWRPGASHE